MLKAWSLLEHLHAKSFSVLPVQIPSLFNDLTEDWRFRRIVGSIVISSMLWIFSCCGRELLSDMFWLCLFEVAQAVILLLENTFSNIFNKHIVITLSNLLYSIWRILLYDILNLSSDSTAPTFCRICNLQLFYSEMIDKFKLESQSFSYFLELILYLHCHEC